MVVVVGPFSTFGPGGGCVVCMGSPGTELGGCACGGVGCLDLEPSALGQGSSTRVAL